MPSTERPIPEWARNERLHDQMWVQSNMGSFFTVASLSFIESGRGAIIVDATTQFANMGHPFTYFTQEMIDQDLDEDTQRMVEEYDPEKELVIVLLKPEEKVSTYRVRRQSMKPSADSL
jgi:hypothetical protein